jgi:hypothetical protein
MEEEFERIWKYKGQMAQQQLQKPTLAQLLSQRFSCEILFNLLASGEKCVFGAHKERKYRYYDPLYTAKSKGQDELEMEFRNQLRCFLPCFIDDVEKGGFRYPDNLNKADIIEDIKKWMHYAKIGKRDLLYNTYQKFIKLLQDENKIEIDKAKKSNDYGPNVISTGIMKGVHKNEVGNFINAGMAGSKLAYELDSTIRKDYEKGDYSIKAMVYQDPPKEKTLFRKLGEKLGLIEKEDDSLI